MKITTAWVAKIPGTTYCTEGKTKEEAENKLRKLLKQSFGILAYSRFYNCKIYKTDKKTILDFCEEALLSGKELKVEIFTIFGSYSILEITNRLPKVLLEDSSKNMYYNILKQNKSNIQFSIPCYKDISKIVIKAIKPKK